jgi:ribA/ribD-fused uncharacterized protein
LGQDNSLKRRKDWPFVKEEIMHQALIYKFNAHPDLAERILSTGQSTLIEDSPVDWYWGIGSDGKGKNRLGVLLMKVRD